MIKSVLCLVGMVGILIFNPNFSTPSLAQVDVDVPGLHFGIGPDHPRYYHRHYPDSRWGGPVRHHWVGGRMMCWNYHEEEWEPCD